MNELKGKRILIFQQRGWGKCIGRFLARKLYAEGCELAALTFKNTTHDLIERQPDAKYEMIISHDSMMNNPKHYLADDKYSLQKICDDLGVDSIWPMVSTLRLLIRSYKDKYYYGFKQNWSDEEIINYIMAVYKCVKVVFTEFNPDIIVAPNFVSFPHILFNLYANKKRVSMIAITGSRIKNISIFAHNFHESEGMFFDRLNALNSGIAESKNSDIARNYIAEFRKNFVKPVYHTIFDKKRNFQQRIKFELSPYCRILKWIIKKPENYMPNIGPTVDYKTPRIVLRDHYCSKYYLKFINNFKYYSLEKVEKFIYFPLQFQPEATIDVMAPYFNNQLETARQLAMSMPGDYTLVVKEHPSMAGYRPPSYIEKIARTVNVKLIDYRIPSEQILKKADMVISPNSTTLIEAAFLNKPAIQLGNFGVTLKLPNVFRHIDMTTMSKKIKEILKINFKTEEYERKLENFIAAAYDTGLSDFNYYGVWERGEKDNMEFLWQFYKKEIERVLGRGSENEIMKK